MNADQKAYRKLADQLGLELVRDIISAFYDKAREHKQLGPYFDHVKNWPEVKERIAHFWWIDMGGERYRDDIYNPVAVHRHFQVPPELIDDWLELFTENLGEFISSEQIAIWKTRLHKFAEWTRIELSKADSGKASPQTED